jgi:hypothetical protein
MKDLIDSNAPWIPSQEDEMLLLAALAPQGRAHDTGIAWLENMDLATQGMATNRLLPLLHDRLIRDGIDHPALAIMKGVRRKVWSRNQLLFKRAIPAIQALRQAGIDVMLLKGAALTLNYYQDYGLRPMDDLDLMVRVTDVALAIEVLANNGWNSKISRQGKLIKNALKYGLEEHFKDSSGLVLDVHWHLSPLCVDPTVNSTFWSDSITAKFDTVDVLLLNPADQLLHICLHGLIWSKNPGIRWIPDSLAILGKAPELNWNRLLLQVQERKVAPFMRSALNYLANKFDASIPIDVLREMNVLTVTSHEAKEFILNTEWRSYHTTNLGNHFSILRTMRVLSYTYRRIAADAKLHGYNVSIMEYLCAYYRKEDVWQLLSYIVYRFGKRASRSMHSYFMSTGPVSHNII